MNVNPTTNPRVVHDRLEVRRLTRSAQVEGKKVGIVMTMGALHAGHLSLVETCVAECDFTIVSIFVNPTQFRPGEDFENYPRHLEDDVAKLCHFAVDVVFAPGSQEMYGEAHSTYVEPPRIAQSLEGRCRAGHFRGVTTVVLKLLNVVSPDVAYFGRKDYQQYLVVRTMCEELDVATLIRLCPTVREGDGLALSSRNQYLDEEQRRRALAICQSMDMAAEMMGEGERRAGKIAARVRQHLSDAGIERIDYIVLVDPRTLEEVREVASETVIAIAAYVGNTRLIDNRCLGDRTAAATRSSADEASEVEGSG